MNEIIDDTKSIILCLFGVIMALLTWFAKRQDSRIERLEQRSVTRDELAETLNQMRDARQQMHRENREELRYIRERVDGIADRQ